jgi:hypothetical protein
MDCELEASLRALPTVQGREVVHHCIAVGPMTLAWVTCLDTAAWDPVMALYGDGPALDGDRLVGICHRWVHHPYTLAKGPGMSCR